MPDKFGTELTRSLNEIQRDYHTGQLTDPFEVVENLRATANHLENIANEQVVMADVATYRVALNLAAQALAELSRQPFDSVVSDLLQKSQQKVGRSVRLVA